MKYNIKNLSYNKFIAKVIYNGKSRKSKYVLERFGKHSK